MPIYSTVQPSAKALGSILTYLTDAKRKPWQVVWVNLWEEAVLQCDSHTQSAVAWGRLWSLTSWRPWRPS